MAKAKLGRGLGSLFDEPIIAANDDVVQQLRITLVEPNKNQPRRSFDDDKIDELSQSIKEHVRDRLKCRPKSGVLGLARQGRGDGLSLQWHFVIYR